MNIKVSEISQSEDRMHEKTLSNKERKQARTKNNENKNQHKKIKSKIFVDRNTLYLKSIEFSLNNRVNNNTIDGFYFS